MEIDNKGTKLCPSCMCELPISDFYVSPNGVMHYRCRECKKNNSKSRLRVHKNVDNQSIDEIQLRSYRKDYLKMYKIFDKIGYDLKQNIHEQFCEKYGLEYNSDKPKVNKSKFTPVYFKLI
jgi:hypothetical protein